MVVGGLLDMLTVQSPSGTKGEDLGPSHPICLSAKENHLDSEHTNSGHRAGAH